MAILRYRMDKIRVYIAGPLTTSGRLTKHIHDAVKVADELWVFGFVPFVPHLVSSSWDVISPKSYEDWMEYDMAWLAQCDCLLRLPGESLGADREVEFARERGIPVFHSIEDVVEYDV